MVLKDRVLLVEMLRLYSEIFLNSKPCSTCEKQHRGYYKRLINDGEQQIKQNEIMSKKTCLLKDNALLYYRGAHYTNANLTDKIALSILKNTPVLEREFVEYPEGYKVKTEAPKLAEAKKKLAESKRRVTNLKKGVVKAEEAITAKEAQIETLADAAQGAAKALKEDPESEDLKKANAEASGEHDKAIEELDDLKEKLEEQKAKVEEAEGDVVKYEAILNKRDK